MARLTRLVDWINERGPYSPDQVWAMRDQFRAILTNRLRVTLDRQRYPDIAEEPIERPIFIIGFARSGAKKTMLHSLLAEDPSVFKSSILAHAFAFAATGRWVGGIRAPGSFAAPG